MGTAQVGTVEHGPTIKNGTCAILCQSVGTAKVPEFQPYINKQPMFHCFLYMYLFLLFLCCVLWAWNGTAKKEVKK